jgi:hypothetical protein
METATEEVKQEAKPAAPVERITQEISADEKLVLREAENQYLKASMQIQALTQQTQAAQKKFTETVEGLGKKYELDVKAFQFDNVELKFVRK